MFSTGSQRKCWMLKNEKELTTLREEANSRFINNFKSNYSRKVSIYQ